MEDLEEFKNHILDLQTSLAQYLSKDNKKNDSKSYNVPGVINKDRQDIKSYLDISNKFSHVMTEKNKLYSEVLENKNFKGGNSNAEMNLKINLIKQKVNN